MAEYQDPIKEARRYLQNAKDILKEKTSIKDGFYLDGKYVKMAGDIAWKGCLLALDSVFKVKASKGESRVSIKNYKEAVGKRDRKLCDLVNDGYNVLHLSMGYDGTKAKNITKTGFELATSIIDRCETMRP